MARQRINLKFIGIASAVVATSVAAAVSYKHFMGHRGDPEVLLKQGDADYQAGQYDEALSCYSQIEAMQPKNGIIHLKVGQTLSKLGGFDPRPALDEFGLAETYLPDNKDAWGGTLEMYLRYLTYLESGPTRDEDQNFMVKGVQSAREAADHVRQLDPDNIAAASAASIIDLRMWLLRLAIPLTPKEREMESARQPTEDQKVEAAMADLSQMMKKRSPNDQIPYWLARAKIYQAAKLRTPGSGPDVAEAQRPLFAEAASEFDDAIAANPKVVKLYLAKADILARLMQTDDSAEPRVGYTKQYRESLETAQGLADIKASREDYFRAKQMYAQSLYNDPGRSEPIFKDLIKQFPERPQVSLAYARILKRDPSRIKDALAVLDGVPAVAPPILRTQDQLRSWDYAYAGIKLERANMQIDQLENMPQGQARKEISDEVAKALAVAATRFDGKVEYLSALGRFQISNGQAREAIDTLLTAKDKLFTADQIDPEVILDLAQAYQMCGQPVDAINLYLATIQNVGAGNNPAIRINLANALLSIKDYDRAGAQVEWLKKRLPAENPMLIKFQIALLRDNPDPKAVADLIAKLPETSIPEMDTKEQIAFDTKDYPDAVRVGQKLAAADSVDWVVLWRLARSQIQSGQKDDATRTVDDAVKKFPDSIELTSLQKLLHGDNVEELYPPQLAAVQKIQDPFLRESAWANLDQKFSRFDEELEHRVNAAGIQPGNIDTNRALFQRYLDFQKFTEATKMVPHLIDINADQAHGKELQVRLYLAERDAANAVAFANQLVKDAPQFWMNYELLGDADQLAGQNDVAVQNYIAAWQKQPANMDVLRALIACEAKLNRVDDARRYIAQARKLYPDNLGYLATHVNFECQHGGSEALLPELSAAVTKSPDQQDGYSLYAEALAATYKAHVDKGDITGAGPFLDDLVTTLKEENRRWPDDLRVARNLADNLMIAKDSKGAEQVVMTASQRPKWKDQPAGQFLVAQFYAAQHKYDVAEPFLRKTVELDPNAIEPQVTLADDLWQQNKKDDALRVLKPVIGRSIDAFAQYDQMLVQMGRGDQAESETNVALSANPKSAELNDLLINVYAMNNRVEQAITLAKAVIKDDPGNIGANLQLGRLQGFNNPPDFDGAIQNIKIFSDARPDNVEAHTMLGQFYRAKNDRENATREFLVAVRLSPQDKAIRLSLLDCYLNSSPPRKTEAQNLVVELLGMEQFKHDPDFERAAAVMWAQNGENAKALGAIRDAVHQTDDPKYSASKPAVMAEYLRVLMLTKSYDQLVDQADKLAADPKAGWGVYSYRARGKDYLGDKAGALDDFKISLDKAGTDGNKTSPIIAGMAVKEQLGLAGAVALIKPRSDNSLLWKLVMVYLYQTDKDYNNALACGEDALKHTADMDPSTERTLTRTVAELAAVSSPPQYDRAAELFRQVLKNTPDDTESMNDLASVLLDSPDHSHYKEALDIITSAVQLSESRGALESRIYDTYGWAMILNGKVDEGLDMLHKACDNADRLPEAHYHLARGYLVKGHPDDATREFETAVTQIAAAHDAGEQVDSTLPDKIRQGQVDAKKLSDSLGAQGQAP